jgi:putative mRNA 3-end processing factor
MSLRSRSRCCPCRHVPPASLLRRRERPARAPVPLPAAALDCRPCARPSSPSPTAGSTARRGTSSSTPGARSTARSSRTGIPTTPAPACALPRDAGRRPVIRHRLGDIRIATQAYGETLDDRRCDRLLPPRGPCPRLGPDPGRGRGEVWVVSGDYKTAPDGLSEPFEPVRAHAFVTECTFGLPVFKWRPQAEVDGRYERLVAAKRRRGPRLRPRRLRARQGAADPRQRGRLHRPDPDPRRGRGGERGPARAGPAPAPHDPRHARPRPPRSPRRPRPRHALRARLALDAPLRPRLHRLRLGLDGAPRHPPPPRRRPRLRPVGPRRLGRPQHAIRETGAETVLVTHGYTAVFRRWLAEQGYDARIVETEFEGEAIDASRTGARPDAETAAP